MRATQVVAPRTIKIIDVPKPEMASGKVLIRTVYASICGTDMPAAMGVRPESAYPMPPGRPGHEIVAFVEDSDTEGFRTGDRVLDTAYDGAMREFHVRDPVDLIPLPNDRPLEEMLMAQPLGTVLHAARKWPSVLGWDTVVVGQGAIGLFFTNVLRMLGARTIVGIDLDDFRLGVAKTMGATHTLNPERDDPVTGVTEVTGGRLADMVVEASGHEATYNMMTPLIRRNGYITIFGLPKQDPTPIRMGGFIQKEPTIFGGYTVGIPDKAAEFTLARDLILQGRLNPSPVITHFLPLEEVQRGFEMAESHDDNAIKIVFRF
jgi:threonine dehydrogenase-like Zn-dependent dehydrogenase